MPYIVRDLPPLIATSSGSLLTSGIGKLDDASSITLFFASSAAAGTSSAILQVSQFDPFDIFPQPGVANQSSGFYNASTSAIAAVSTNGGAIVLSNISFRGIRISGMTSSTATAGEIIAYVSKQVSV